MSSAVTYGEKIAKLIDFLKVRPRLQVEMDQHGIHRPPGWVGQLQSRGLAVHIGRVTGVDATGHIKERSLYSLSGDDSWQPPGDSAAKSIATLAASFALVGAGLRTICKGDREYFEIRRGGECRTVSTLHDVTGILAAISEGSK